MIFEDFILGMAFGLSMWVIPCLWLLFSVLRTIKSSVKKMSGTVNALVPMLGALAPMASLFMPGGKKPGQPPFPQDQE